VGYQLTYSSAIQTYMNMNLTNADTIIYDTSSSDTSPHPRFFIFLIITLIPDWFEI